MLASSNSDVRTIRKPKELSWFNANIQRENLHIAFFNHLKTAINRTVYKRYKLVINCWLHDQRKKEELYKEVHAWETSSTATDYWKERNTTVRPKRTPNPTSTNSSAQPSTKVQQYGSTRRSSGRDTSSGSNQPYESIQHAQRQGYSGRGVCVGFLKFVCHYSIFLQPRTVFLINYNPGGSGNDQLQLSPFLAPRTLASSLAASCVVFHSPTSSSSSPGTTVPLSSESQVIPGIKVSPKEVANMTEVTNFVNSNILTSESVLELRVGDVDIGRTFYSSQIKLVLNLKTSKLTWEENVQHPLSLSSMLKQSY